MWFQAGKKVGLSDAEVESFLKEIKEDAVKEKLKQTTQQAIDLGVRALAALILFVTICLNNAVYNIICITNNDLNTGNYL